MSGERRRLAERIFHAIGVDLVWKDFDAKTKAYRISKKEKELIISALTSGGAGSIDDDTWRRALNCALSQFEGYVRRNELETSEQRRSALDDALQHAIGIISLVRSTSGGAGERDGWQRISTRPEVDDLMWFFNSSSRSIEGPRSAEYDDADRFDWWCPCDYPELPE